jgi:hypothetical protein
MSNDGARHWNATLIVQPLGLLVLSTPGAHGADPASSLASRATAWRSTARAQPT